MAVNPVKKIQNFGQSVWLDYIRRGILKSGELERLITTDGLRGVTVNPSILEKSIIGSHDYDEAIHSLVLEGLSAPEIYETLAIEDVRKAADLFYPIYKKTDGRHGFVSIEVSPHLAYETEKTIVEARRFWRELDRPNVMIKVPGTKEGLAAIEKLTEEGINVNVTLLFGLQRYREVISAYRKGLKVRMMEGKPLYHINSVASFFLSRIDVLIDPNLEKYIKSGGYKGVIAAGLHGQVAISSAKMAYQIYKEIFSNEDFQELLDEGARSQRLLWASTSTKNPNFSDIKYVESLIGQNTVNTIPLKTLNAYRDHGNPKPRLEDNVENSIKVLDELSKVGVDLDRLTQQLEDEGVDKFIKSYNHLINTIEDKTKTILGKQSSHQVIDLGSRRSTFTKRLKILSQDEFTTRLWNKDASLWKGDHQVQDQIRSSLGWLNVAEKMEENLQELHKFVKEVEENGFRHIVHIGMGGSSLSPMVMNHILASSKSSLAFNALDTTSPDKILELEQFLPLAKTLFIVASKSGTTAETRALADYFYKRVANSLGKEAGENFVAITDPGSPLQAFAIKKGFRQVFLNFPDIGGRYSALSYFGLVPAMLMGIDVAALLRQAIEMKQACASSIPLEKNPGAQLGALLGEMYKQSRDKVTFILPDSLKEFGMWLEQLLAESTGKDGKGLLPITNEPSHEPAQYSDDRLFVCLRLNDGDNDDLDERLEMIRKFDHPVVTIELEDRIDLGQEFFRWEFAVAIAGAIIGINPFDQPNVQESKANTNRILESIKEHAELPEEEPILTDGTIEVYARSSGANLAEVIIEFLAQAKSNDYITLMAYLTEEPNTNQALQELRSQFGQLTHLATTMGYGPRLLHSTGQYHKGGPNTGLFIQLTANQNHKLPVPGQPYNFDTFLKAQALGDFKALQDHDRRVIRIHFGDDIDWGLWVLTQVVKAANQAVKI